MLKKVIKIVLIVAAVFGLAFGGIVVYFYFQHNSTFLDQPSNLENKIETIEVDYVNWACDCANFYETKKYKNSNDGELLDSICIFIEPKDEKNKILESYFDSLHFTKYLKLTGSYYREKGIPTSYNRKTSEKPEYARVFQYESFVMVDKESRNEPKAIYNIKDSTFESFYNSFRTDTTFQLERIKFPIKGKYQSNEIEKVWTKDEWPFMGWDLRTRIQDDSISLVQNKDRIFYGTYCIDCGFSYEMEFNKINGDWYLTYRQENNY